MLLALPTSGCDPSSSPALPQDVGAIRSHEDVGGLAANLLLVTAQCDHQPKRPSSVRQSGLSLSVRLKNKTSESLHVTLARCFVSLAEGEIGTEVSGLTIRGDGGASSGATRVMLSGEEERSLELFGLNLYPEDRHERELFVTVILSCRGKDIVLRRQGRIRQTM